MIEHKIKRNSKFCSLIGFVFFIITSFIMLWIFNVPGSAQDLTSEMSIRHEELARRMKEAKAAGVPDLSPLNFVRAEEAFTAVEQAFMNKAVPEQLHPIIDKALQLLDAAFESAEIARIALHDLVELRRLANQLNAKTHAAGEFATAERLFKEAVMKIESGDLAGAKQRVEAGENLYGASLASVIRNQSLNQARILLDQAPVNVSGQRLDQARRELALVEQELNSLPGSEIKVLPFLLEIRNRIHGITASLNGARESGHGQRSNSGGNLYALPLAKSGPNAKYGLAFPRESARPELVLELFRLLHEQTKVPVSPESVQGTQEPTGGPSVTSEPIQEKTTRFGGVLTWDSRTNLPGRITGMRARPAFPQEDRRILSQNNVERVLKRFLRDNESLFGVRPEDLRLEFARKIDDTWYVRFQQTYENIPVYRTTVGFSASAEGTVTDYSSNFDPSIDAPTTPQISQDAAVLIAKNTYDPGNAVQLDTTETALIIYPEHLDDQVTYHLAWRILFESNEPDHTLNQYFIIDAVSGRIIIQGPNYKYQSVKGTVTGRIHPVNPNNPPLATRNLAYAYVDIQGNGRATTDKSGDYQRNTASAGSHQVTFRLDGPYASVEDIGTGGYSTTVSGNTTGDTDHLWTATDRDHINVFYHMNWFHDWLKDRFKYTWNSDKQMKAFVNDASLINNGEAMATGSTISFGRDESARSSDIIYHEYTHNMINDIFSGWIEPTSSRTEANSMDEGFADYFASATTNDSEHAEGNARPGGPNTRDLDNTMQYPGPIGYNIEQHEGGQIISGACWDLRTSFTVSKSVDYLVYHTLNLLSTQSSPYYFSRADKSNFLSAIRSKATSITSITMPKAWEINQAFRNHDLLPVDLYVRDHSSDGGDVPSNPSGQAIDESPDIRVDAPPFNAGDNDDAVHSKINKVYVRIHNSGYNKSSSGSPITVTLYQKSKSGWSYVGMQTTTAIAADKSKEVSIDWTPPQQGVTTLLAKVSSSEDTITKDGDTAMDNNIAQKRVKMKDTAPPDIVQIIHNGITCIRECGNLGFSGLGGLIGLHHKVAVGVQATITDNVSGVNTNKVELSYRFCKTGGGCSAWSAVKPNNQVNDTYIWDLGSFTDVGDVEFYITAEDKRSNKQKSKTYKITVTDECSNCAETWNMIEVYSILPIKYIPLGDPPWTQFEQRFQTKIRFTLIPAFDYTNTVISKFAEGDIPSALVVDTGRLQNWGEMGFLQHFMPMDEMIESNPDLFNEYSNESMDNFRFTKNSDVK